MDQSELEELQRRDLDDLIEYHKSAEKDDDPIVQQNVEVPGENATVTPQQVQDAEVRLYCSSCPNQATFVCYFESTTVDCCGEIFCEDHGTIKEEEEGINIIKIVQQGLANGICNTCNEKLKDNSNSTPTSDEKISRIMKNDHSLKIITAIIMTLLIFIGASVFINFGKQSLIQSIFSKNKPMVNLNQPPQDAVIVKEIFNVAKSRPLVYFDQANLLIHITTDKMMYRPGETVYTQGYLIDSITKVPNIVYSTKTEYSKSLASFQAQTEFVVDPNFEIFDSFGNMLDEFKGNFDFFNGILTYSFELPTDFKGGVYTIMVGRDRRVFFYRTFRVERYQQQELYVTADFDKTNYSPGDRVEVKVKVKRPDGRRHPLGTSVQPNPSIEGFEGENTLLDGKGEAIVKFVIPRDYSEEILSISIKTFVGYTFGQETYTPNIATFSVNIINRNGFMVKFVSESLENKNQTLQLVPEVSNKIYFQVYSEIKETLKREMVEFTGAQLLEDDQVIIDYIQHWHNGRSFFQFVPQIGRNYSLRVYRDFAEEKQISKVFPLKANINTNETLMMSQVKVYTENGTAEEALNSIQFSVETNRNYTQKFDRVMLAKVSNKNRDIFEFQLDLVDGAQLKYFSIDLQNIYNTLPNGGVMSLSVYEERSGYNSTRHIINLYRLINVKPSQKIDFTLKTDKKAYVPGETVVIKIEAPVVSERRIFASIKVIDVSSFIKIPKYKHAPSLASMVYLEREVYELNINNQEFWYSDKYMEYFFETNETQGYYERKNEEYYLLYVDLLLGVQEWRRGQYPGIYKEKIEERYILDKDTEELALEQKDMLKYVYPTLSKYQTRGPPDKYNIPLSQQKSFNEYANLEIDIQTKPVQQTDQKQRLNQWLYRHSAQDETDDTQTLFLAVGQQIKQNSTKNEHLLIEKFDLNAQVSQFLIQVDVYSEDGRYGVTKQMIVSTKDVYIQYTLPVSMVIGDIYNIPLTIVNNHASSNFTLKFEESFPDILRKSEVSLEIIGNSQFQTSFQLDTTDFAQLSKDYQLVVRLYEGDKLVDKATKKCAMRPDGFLNKVVKSAVLSSKQPVEWEVKLRDDIISEPIFGAKVYSQNFEVLLDSVESLQVIPTGCFEQLSASVYPMLMIIQYLIEIRDQFISFDLYEKTQKSIEQFDKLIKIGYEKLLTYETSEYGFEWWGNPPGHIALSAYGLMMFEDIKKVVNVGDQLEIQRTQEWLVQQRNQASLSYIQGGYDQFINSRQEIQLSYVLWTLSQTSISQDYFYEVFEQEYNELKNFTANNDDPYVLALYTSSLANAGQTDQALEMGKLLTKYQNTKLGEDLIPGFVLGATGSITQSMGKSLLLETTALAVLAWLDTDPTYFFKNIEDGIQAVIGGYTNYGMSMQTQSTILTLKAVVKYQKVYTQIPGEGSFNLEYNGKLVQSLLYENESKNVDLLTKFDFTDALNNAYDGQKNFKLKLSAKTSSSQEINVQYFMKVSYYSLNRAQTKNPPLSFIKRYSPSNTWNVGDIQTQIIQIENISGKSQGMILAEIQVPSCYQIDMNQLELLKAKNSIQQFEIANDQQKINIYWTKLDKDEVKTISLRRVRIYTGKVCLERPSQAYPYYAPDEKVEIK